MFYITGDTHGDFTRLSNKNWPAAKSLTKDDVLVICGDFGGVWADTKDQKYWLDWLEERPFTVCFADGNHENFDALDAYPVATWNGGKVHFVRPHVIHLMRGQVFDIQGARVFVMGGAASHDVKDGILDPEDPNFKNLLLAKRWLGQQFRVKGRSWWPQEMPSDEEYEEARRNLDACGWKVDIVVSHCGPTEVIRLLDRNYGPDRLTDFLQEVSDRLDYDFWYFGHYHTNAVPTDKHAVLYKMILPGPRTSKEVKT